MRGFVFVDPWTTVVITAVPRCSTGDARSSDDVSNAAATGDTSNIGCRRRSACGREPAAPSLHGSVAASLLPPYTASQILVGGIPDRRVYGCPVRRGVHPPSQWIHPRPSRPRPRLSAPIRAHRAAPIRAHPSVAARASFAHLRPRPPARRPRTPPPVCGRPRVRGRLHPSAAVRPPAAVLPPVGSSPAPRAASA